MPSSHTTLPTPSPRERSLLVTVEESVFAANPDILPAQGTRYADCPKALFSRDYNKKFDDYVYTGQQGAYGILFVKSKTQEQRNTPFETDEITEEVDWLAVINWITFEPNYGAPRTQSTVDSTGGPATILIPRWVVRRSYVHGQQLITRVIVRRYLSEVPWPPSMVESDEPMGTEIQWDLEGNSGTTGRCLHPEKTVPGQGSAYAVVGESGNREATMGSDNRSQYVPKTNHTRWQDFITNDVQRVEPRQFLREEKTYIAPTMPEESLLV